MEKYFDAALETIRRANEYFGKDNRKVRAGIVIYRDYTDGRYVTEYLSLRNAKDVSISDFLRKGGKYGVKSNSEVINDTKALYRGLELALDTITMGYSAHVAQLVAYHMIPYTDQKCQDTWRSRMGEELWKEVVELHRYDEAAH